MCPPSPFEVHGPAVGGSHALIIGDAALLGVDGSFAGEEGLVDAVRAGLAARPLDRLGVQVLSNLLPALHTVSGLAANSRLGAVAAVVVAVSDDVTLRACRELATLLAAIGRDAAGPVIVIVHAETAGRGSRGSALLRRLVAALGAGERAVILPARVDGSGRLADVDQVAAAALAALRPGSTISDREASDREVAVDRSLVRLRGRTSHLQRAVVLAQNSFDVPYAQLNLVSRGTLRSLAYIGRSSDGLHQSLSAEAVRDPSSLLIADTHAVPGLAHIPEIHGPRAIRYYAGHPVRADSGHRVGVLCVLDTEPHDILPGDDVLIRDLALLAEGELAALTN